MIDKLLDWRVMIGSDPLYAEVGGQFLWMIIVMWPIQIIWLVEIQCVDFECTNVAMGSPNQYPAFGDDTLYVDSQRSRAQEIVVDCAMSFSR